TSSTPPPLPKKECEKPEPDSGRLPPLSSFVDWNAALCHAISLKRQPRILVVTSTFPRWPKDNEPRFILDLCRHLADFAEIRVLAPHAPGAAIEETLEGVDVTRFRYFFERWQSVTYAGGIVGRIRQNPWRLLQVPLF